MFKIPRFLLSLIGLFLFNLHADGQLIDWQTRFEKSNFLETPRYDETVRYCKQLAYNSDFIRYSNFGTSPQGRELPLLILSKDKLFTPEQARASQKAVILIQAAIHAGEPDGKDAGLMLFRDLFIDGQSPEILEHVVILFIPIFNVDGHEIWSQYSRINQNGPVESGWRATAQNLNLNRDYMKADAPEMRAWLNLFHTWLPDFFVDCHTTDGADYQYEITYGMETHGTMDPALTQWQVEEFIPSMTKYMDRQQMPIFPYIQFRKWHDPRSGLRSGVASPITSTGYVALMNRPALLIETHMLKPYKNRVFSTYQMLKFTISYVNENYLELQSHIARAEKNTASKSFRRKSFPLKYAISPKDSTMIEFKGIEYEILTSEITGHPWYKYGHEKANFTLPFFNVSEPEISVKLPEAYFLPREWIDVIEVLDAHHIQYSYLEETINQDYESYEFPEVEWGKRPFEGRIQLSLKQVKPIEDIRVLQQGTLIIPIEQPRAKLIAYLLEPQSESSFIAWGFFNSIFEQKEYAETYVIEKMAKDLLRDKPKVKEEFERKMKEEPEFAQNHYAITNWLYQHTPYYDTRINKYPICKLRDLKKPEYHFKPTSF